MKTPNIFNYATSELSQDAFLCYLCEFGMEKFKNSEEYKLAHKFLALCAIPEDEKIENIKRQYCKIDVLIETENFFLIIEDKTDTNEHDDQISRYAEIMHSENKNKKIKVCYFKTGDYVQDYKADGKILSDKDVYSLRRKDILGLLENYHKDKIINMFYDKLASVENEIKNCDENDISTWTKSKWFDVIYNALKNNNKITDRVNIEDVPNAQGGFYGCWFDFKRIEELTVYKQIEIHIKDNKTEKVNLCLRCDAENKDIAKKHKEDMKNWLKKAEKIGYISPRIHTGKTTAFAYQEAKTKDDVLDFINDDILTKL